MRGLHSNAWAAGFEAGESFATQCPYLSGSMDALDWFGGWIAGATHALGQGNSRVDEAAIEWLPLHQLGADPCLRH